MNNKNKAIDFASVLAASAHDMKNSLCMLLQSIEELTEKVSAQVPESSALLATMQYEASRLNTDLMQMLSLYRAEKDRFPINIQHYYIEDVVEELLAANQSYIANKGIELSIELDEELCWYLDADLIHVLLNDVLINAMRYGRKKIQIKAWKQDCLYIRVEDDGEGYPLQMLELQENDGKYFNIERGRTGLGLFFAKMIAQAHGDEKNNGSIKLTNGGTYGGSVFTLKLP